LPIWQGAGAALLIAGSTCAAVRLSRQYPYGIVGLFWYLGTLVPVIGLVQVGKQAMADRYTYIPLTGLFIVVAWGFSDLLGKWRYRKIFLAVLAAIILSALTVRTFLQVGYWQNAVTLFENAIKVTPDNPLAQNNLGAALYEDGRFDEASAYFTKAIQINPEYANAHNNLAILLSGQGKYEEAELHYLEAIKFDTEHPDAHYNLGSLLLRQKRYKEAGAHFAEMIKIDPTYAKAYNKIGFILAQQGKLQGAREFLKKATQLDPDDLKARDYLEILNRKILPEIELQ
jgi:tetratricopeptide (TPR) repeat protein